MIARQAQPVAIPAVPFGVFYAASSSVKGLELPDRRCGCRLAEKALGNAFRPLADVAAVGPGMIRDGTARLNTLPAAYGDPDGRGTTYAPLH
jgi:hypothetical protein